MNSKLAFSLALAAGFTGGLASRYLEPAQVQAQAQIAPAEFRAQRFVLVDETGVTHGAFWIETNGAPELEVVDAKGRVFAAEFKGWSQIHGFFDAGTGMPSPKKPTLLAIKP
jgi:hypothetical protein